MDEKQTPTKPLSLRLIIVHHILSIIVGREKSEKLTRAPRFIEDGEPSDAVLVVIG